MLNFLLETFVLGIKNLHLHKLRSLLTALGIIIGVAAVIIMVAIGEGTKLRALEQLRQLGAKNIIIRTRRPPESSDSGQRTTRNLQYGIKRVDLKRIATLPKLTRIVPLRDTEKRVVHGDTRAQANAIATVPDAFDVISLRLQRGRYFNEVDCDRLAAVCVIGAKVCKDLFPYQDPLGETITVGDSNTGRLLLEVIGVLEPTGLRTDGSGGMINRNLDEDLYFPLQVGETLGDQIYRIQAGSREIKTIELSEIWLQTEAITDVEQTAALAENVMQIGHKGPLDFEVKAPIQILRAAEEQSRMFNYIMGGIAGFALVVGGIGIMNIMLATVTERTREIGIRRALGAKRRHITLQFLIETTVISLSGGLIGVSAGCAAAKALPVLLAMFNAANAYPTSITTWSVAGSFVISGLIGIVFGLYPAIKAAYMNPIEALRHE